MPGSDFEPATAPRATATMTGAMIDAGPDETLPGQDPGHSVLLVRRHGRGGAQRRRLNQTRAQLGNEAPFRHYSGIPLL
jgi:hypothetical protein